jgi:hypothetical protein
MGNAQTGSTFNLLEKVEFNRGNYAKKNGGWVVKGLRFYLESHGLILTFHGKWLG